MNLIACVDKNWAIGNKGELLVSIPSDKKLFKELTDGKVVIGGRKTMEAIPGGTTLGGRTNIILTSDKKYTYGNAVIVHMVDCDLGIPCADQIKRIRILCFVFGFVDVNRDCRMDIAH